MRQGCRYQSKGSNCRNCGLTKECRLDQGSTFQNGNVTLSGAIWRVAAAEAMQGGHRFRPLSASSEASPLAIAADGIYPPPPTAPRPNVTGSSLDGSGVEIISEPGIHLRTGVHHVFQLHAGGRPLVISLMRPAAPTQSPWVRRDAHSDEERPASSAAGLTTCRSPPEPQADVGNLLS